MWATNGKFAENAQQTSCGMFSSERTGPEWGAWSGGIYNINKGAIDTYKEVLYICVSELDLDLNFKDSREGG
jgi:hypothetical protein